MDGNVRGCRVSNQRSAKPGETRSILGREMAGRAGGGSSGRSLYHVLDQGRLVSLDAIGPSNATVASGAANSKHDDPRRARTGSVGESRARYSGDSTSALVKMRFESWVVHLRLSS